MDQASQKRTRERDNSGGRDTTDSLRTRDRARDGTGATVLDLASLTAGAAVAAVHLRDPDVNTPSHAPAFLFWLAFTGIAVTATGPLLAVIQRLRSPPTSGSRWGRRLWVVLGTPWVVTAPLRNVPATPQAAGTVYTPAVLVSVSAACVAVLLIVWKHWIRPGAVAALDEEPLSWTERIGMLLAFTWPLQYGFAMIAVSL
jgi:hypothetical protein